MYGPGAANYIKLILSRALRDVDKACRFVAGRLHTLVTGATRTVSNCDWTVTDGRSYQGSSGPCQNL